MSQSVGGLFLQVKLDTSKAESQLKDLGRTFSREVDPAAMSRSAAAAAAAQSKALIAEQKAQAQALKTAGIDATTQANVQTAQIKERIAAQKAEVEQQKVAARTQAAQVTATNAQTRAQAALSVETAKTQRLVLSDELRQRRKAETAELNAQKQALKEARQEAEKLAGIKSPLAASGGLLGAGAQDLFIGLGAARSGNVGYGLAAITRYFGAMASEAGVAGAAVTAATVAVAAIGVAALAAAAGIAYLSTQIVEAGTQGAANFQLLQIQIGGLLGSASKGKEEFDWLLKLGQTSLVPTQSLVQADRQLLAFGVTATNVRRELVSFISDLGSSINASEEQVYFLSLAISQIVAKGKADAIDLRQLANVGVDQARLFAIIGQQTGQTTKQVRESVTAGTLTASQVVAGLIGYQKDLKTTADQAAKSVEGLKQNLGDTFTTLLSQTFLNAGVLQPIQDFLSGLMTSLTTDKGLFDNLAVATTNLFNAILGGGTAQDATSLLDTLFRQVLPAAIQATADAINFIRPILADIGNAISQAFGAVSEALQASGIDWTTFVAILASGVAQIVLITRLLASIGVVAIGAFTAAIYGARAFGDALVGRFDLAFADIRNGMVAMATDALRLNSIWSGVDAKVSSTTSKAGGIGPGGKSGKDTSTSASTAAKTAATSAQQDAAVASAAAQKIATARDALFNLVKSYFGQPSQALKGLFGDAKSFTATADSIASSASSIRDALTQIVPENSPIVAFIDKETRKLLSLAAQRDKVTEQLTAAQDKLKSLVQERDSFIAQLQQQASSFVFSLNVGTQTQTTQLDNSGSFSTVTGPGSFAASVKAKLAAYKAFVANIRTLEKEGLDKSIIRQFLEAGPDAAGAIVAQVASGGSGVIADLNDAQRELSKLSKQFGVEQGGVFYAAGIAQAQSLVSGLTAKQAQITAAAKAITTAILAKIKPLAAKMKDAGSSAAGALGDGLTAGLGNLPDLSAAVGDPFGGIFGADANKKIKQQASDLVDSLLQGLDPNGTARHVHDIFAIAFGGIETAVNEGLGGAALSIYGWIDDLPRTIRTAIGNAKLGLSQAWHTITDGFPTWDELSKLLDGLLGPVLPFIRGIKTKVGDLNLWGILTRGLPGKGFILKALGAAFTGVQGFLGGLPALITGALGGDLWSVLTSGIPSTSRMTRLLSSIPQAFVGIINTIIGLWNAIDFSFSLTIPDWFKFIPGLQGLAGASWTTGDIFPDIKPVSLATGGIAKAPTLAVVGDAPRSSGELVAPLPPGFNMADLTSSRDVVLNAQVFIGDRDITDIVDTRVASSDARTSVYVTSGRRY